MITLNEELKKEADKLLEVGLYNLLQHYGDIVFTGSYELDLMVWRDLDIYMDVENISQEDIYNIINNIFKLYKPVWAETKDTHLDDSGCPKGYFIGFESNVIDGNLWNVDIWFTNKEYIKDNIKYIENIQNKLNDEKRRTLISLKKDLCNNSFYGHKFFSIDVYEAVLEHEVNTLSQFKAWLKEYRNVII